MGWDQRKLARGESVAQAAYAELMVGEARPFMHEDGSPGSSICTQASPLSFYDRGQFAMFALMEVWKNGEPAYRTALVVLVDHSTPGAVGFKFIDETMGPCATRGVPLSMLNALTPTESAWANRWRADAFKAHGIDYRPTLDDSALRIQGVTQ